MFLYSLWTFLLASICYAIAIKDFFVRVWPCFLLFPLIQLYAWRLVSRNNFFIYLSGIERRFIRKSLKFSIKKRKKIILLCSNIVSSDCNKNFYWSSKFKCSSLHVKIKISKCSAANNKQKNYSDWQKQTVKTIFRLELSPEKVFWN